MFPLEEVYVMRYVLVLVLGDGNSIPLAVVSGAAVEVLRAVILLLRMVP